MSSGQKPRQPLHFPRMKHRARKRWRAQLSNALNAIDWDGLLDKVDWDTVMSRPLTPEELRSARFRNTADLYRDVLADANLTWTVGGDHA